MILPYSKKKRKKKKEKMRSIKQSKILVAVHFLIVVTIAVFLLGGSHFQCHARSLPVATVSCFGIGTHGGHEDTLMGSSFRALGNLLPKGQPVPPSGPSPEIN
ncbi:hypothetical protein COLO4_30177 [Corchorus olitorius]|uniref:Uncharacterized protein n=1 Tax=Corchorus olitorius TaxID=93759 RepID=A0A1R3HAH5_9ROSI|nr:hypothetical protein COLO4_30177 [Corchorus olitorius]